MLNQEERRALARIELVSTLADPRFAEGLRTGYPRRPQEYRRWPGAFLIVLGVMLILLAVASGNWLFALLGTAALPAGGLIWPRRRLDRPRPCRWRVE